MKIPMRRLALLACTFLAGCGHVEMTPEGDANREVTGTVNLRVQADLPADTTVLVRVIDGARAEPTLRVLGEQAIQRLRSALGSHIEQTVERLYWHA